MRAFVTGATGWVGSVVVDELLGAGHQVVGLSRSGEKAAVLAGKGADVLRGTLDDLDLLADAAGNADAVIHLAFDLPSTTISRSSRRVASRSGARSRQWARRWLGRTSPFSTPAGWRG